LQCFVENISKELHEDFIELAHNLAMKSDHLKSFPIDILWVVSSKSGTGNKGTNEKLGKNGTFSILGWNICMVWRFGFWENFNT